MVSTRVCGTLSEGSNPSSHPFNKDINMKINWHKKIGMQEENYGAAVLLGGLLQLVFGFSFGLIPLTIFIVTLIAFILSLKYDRTESLRIRMAWLGILITVVMVILYFMCGWIGFVGTWVIPKYISLSKMINLLI
jgi:lipopolysaccharide export LptBFGC system permease protein LptF